MKTPPPAASVFVDRPTITSGRSASESDNKRRYDLAALLETDTNGRAIAVPLHGEYWLKLRRSMDQRVRVRGYRLHALLRGRELICWVERKTP